jgi:hypothetical protein
LFSPLSEERRFGDFSQHFASWVAEICQGLGLAVYLDKTNLSRIVDDLSLRSALAASRAVVGIVSNEACRDPCDMTPSQMNPNSSNARRFARARSEPGFGFCAKNTAEIRSRFSFWSTNKQCVHFRKPVHR